MKSQRKKLTAPENLSVGSNPISEAPLLVRNLGCTDYQRVWDKMRSFTDSRETSTSDELWITEHEPVFTMGQAALQQHLLMPGTIPVVKTDRGGQVTYHGPGQIVAYLLRNLRAHGDGVHDFVHGLEQSMIDMLATYGITANRIEGTPGVYVDGKKIGALGLRIRRGCSYHGISLNVRMDLEPFLRINPCGLIGMEVSQVSAFVPHVSFDEAVERLVGSISQRFGYDTMNRMPDTSDFWVA